MAAMGGFPGEYRPGPTRATSWSVHLHLEALLADVSAALEDDVSRGDVLEGVTVRLENLVADLREQPRPNYGPAPYLPEGYARGRR